MDPRNPSPAPANSRTVARVLAIAVGVYIVLRLALLAWAAWRVRFVMDEMCFLTQFRYLDAGLYRGFDPVKTVLGLFAFNAPRAFFSDAASLLLGARAVGLAIAAAAVAMAGWAALRLTGTNLGAATAVASLLSFSNFTERSFRIRADSLSTLFAAAALAVAVGPGKPAARAWAVGGLAGAAFLSTQKAVYVALAFGIAYLVTGAQESDWRQALLQAARYSAGWCAAVLAYAVYFGGLGFGGVLRQVFLSPLDVALRAPSAYDNLQYYVTLSLRQNALLYVLGLTALGLGLARWRSRRREQRWADVATVVLVPLVLLHSQPWPYVLALPQVFLAVVIPEIRQLGAARPRLLRWSARALLPLAVLGSLPRGVVYPWAHTNHEQLDAVRQAEELLAGEDRYFDGIGMIPTRQLAGSPADWWWDRPTLTRLHAEFKHEDLHVLERVLEDHPKLWILNYRTLDVWSAIRQVTRTSYVHAAPVFYVAGVNLPPSAAETRFECPWAGAYRLFDRAGRPLEEDFQVDGAPAGRIARIEPGVRSIRRLAAGPAAVLLPADVALRRPIPPPQEGVPNLFADVYEF